MTDRELKALMAAMIFAGQDQAGIEDSVIGAENILAEIDQRAVKRSNVPKTPPKQ